MILSKPDGMCTIEMTDSKKVLLGFHTKEQAQVHRNAIVELCVNQSAAPKTLQFHFTTEDSVSDIAQTLIRTIETMRNEAVELMMKGSPASEILFAHANAIVFSINEALAVRRPIFGEERKT